MPARASGAVAGEVVAGDRFLRAVVTVKRLVAELRSHADFGQNDALLMVLQREMAVLQSVWDTLGRWLELAEKAVEGAPDEEAAAECIGRRQLCAALHGAHIIASLDERYGATNGGAGQRERCYSAHLNHTPAPTALECHPGPWWTFTPSSRST